MKFTILVDPPFVIINTVYSVCLIFAQEIYERRFLIKDINFTLFTPKSSPFGVGVKNLNISCLPTQQMIHTKFGIYDPVFVGKMLIDESEWIEWPTNV